MHRSALPLCAVNGGAPNEIRMIAAFTYDQS
jgi:hypothetical protein